MYFYLNYKNDDVIVFGKEFDKKSNGSTENQTLSAMAKTFLMKFLVKDNEIMLFVI